MLGRSGFIGSGRLAVLVSLSFLCGGCVPLMPHLVKDRTLTDGTVALNCHVKQTSVDAALKCLVASKEEMEGGVGNIGDYKKILGYLGVAGGSVAGARVAKNEANTAPLKN